MRHAAGWPSMTQAPPPIVSIIGWHNSGKTTIATALVRCLKQRGLHVAVIKHSREDVDLDQTGTDTWLLAQAGADLVAISSQGRLALLEQPAVEVPLSDVVRRLPHYIDLVITEGYKREPTPKIEVIRPGYGHGRIQSPGELLAVVSSDPNAADDAPLFGLDEVDALADLVVMHLSLREDAASD